MYCYSCEESYEKNLKTISVSTVNQEPVSRNAKLGNGYAIISLLK